jgi:hypothetical protein
MDRLNRARTTTSIPALATAAPLVCLIAFASLASGAARIETRRPAGRIVIVKARFAPASALAPGDRVQRVLELKTGGRARVAVTISTRKRSALLDPTLGLRVKIERCSKPWRAVGRAYACHGKTTTAVPDGPALGRHRLRKLSRRGKNHLRVTLTLPESAPTPLEGQSARLAYRFT